MLSLLRQVITVQPVFYCKQPDFFHVLLEKMFSVNGIVNIGQKLQPSQLFNPSLQPVQKLINQTNQKHF